MTDAELDRMLGPTMRAWPTPSPAVDVAAVAIGRARAAAVRRVRRWTAVVTAVAGAAAVALALLVVRARLSAGGFAAWVDTTSSATTGGTATAAQVSWVLIGAAVTMASFVVLAAWAAWDGADPQRWPAGQPGVATCPS